MKKLLSIIAKMKQVLIASILVFGFLNSFGQELGYYDFPYTGSGYTVTFSGSGGPYGGAYQNACGAGTGCKANAFGMNGYGSGGISVTFNFSSAVNNVVIRQGAINAGNITTVTTNGGGLSFSASGLVCGNAVYNNSLGTVSWPSTGSNYNDENFKVTAASSFTTMTVNVSGDYTLLSLDMGNVAATKPSAPTSVAATPSTICSGSAVNLTATAGSGNTVYWYSGGCAGTYLGTGNITVYPSTTTTYYAKNYNGQFSDCATPVSVTVNTPATAPTSASGTPTSATGANLAFNGADGGTGTATYYWVVGTSPSVAYDGGVAQGSTTTNAASTSALASSTTYYLRVYANNSLCAASSYYTSASFRTHSAFAYAAGANGSLSGSTSQTVAYLANGSAVTANPAANYHFVNWSDGSTANPRTDVGGNNVNVTANFAINVLEFSVQPSSTIAGDNIVLTVRIKDSYGNIMTNSDQDITLAIGTNPLGGVLTGTTITTVNGVARTTASWINKVGTGYKLTAAAGPLTGATSSAFNITPAVIDHFTVTGITDPVVAGTTTTPVVTAYDPYDNVKTNYPGTIVFTSDDARAVLPANYTFVSGDNGVHTFTNGVTLKTTLEHSVTVTGDTKTGSQTSITVTPAAIYSFALVANPDGGGAQQSITAGVPFSVKATVYDEFGNIKTDYVSPHSVIWTSNATPSRSGMVRAIPANGDQAFTAGVATVGGFILYNAHQTPTITIADGPTSSVGTTAVITVKNTELDNFLVVAGTSQRATVPFDITVTARDVYYNTCLDYTGSVRFKSSDDALVTFPTGLQAFAISDAGVRTFDKGISISRTGAYWVRAADSQYAYKQGSQRDIMVEPGPFTASTSLFTIDSSTKIAGQEVVVTLTPHDSDGNRLLSCQNLSVSLDGVNVGVPQNNGTETGFEGIYIFHVLVTSTTAPNIITAKLGTNPFSGSYTITVNPAPPSLAHTTIVPDAGSMTTDGNQIVTVQLKDIYNNLRTTNDGVVSLTTNLGGFGGNNASKTVTATYNGTGSGSYSATLYASYGESDHGVGTAAISGSIAFNAAPGGPGVWDGPVTEGDWPANGSIIDGASVTIDEGLPNLTTSTVSASPGIITTNETSAITVQLKDFLGNLIPTDRGAVTLTVSPNGAVASPATFSAGDGLYHSTLSGHFPGSGSTTISAALTGTVTGAITHTASVTFNEGLPDLAHIQITASPTSMTSDGSSVITVQLKDIYGNNITTSRGTITLSRDKGALTAVTDHANGTYTAILSGDNRGFGDATITGHLVDATDAIEGDITDNAVVNITEGLPVLSQITVTAGSTSITADGTSLITVQLKDQWGNNITNSRGTITLANSLTGGNLTAVHDNNDGTYTATFSMTATGVGTATITATLAGTVSGVVTHTATIDVAPGAATKLTVLTQPSSTAIAGVVFGTQPQIRVEDQFGNLRNSDNATVITAARSIGSDVLKGTLTATVSGGIATFTDLYYTKAETINLGFTSSPTLTATTSNQVVVSAAAANYLAVTGTSSQEAGTSQTLTVTAYDAFNNRATGYTGGHSLILSGANPSSSPAVMPNIAGASFGASTNLVFNSGAAAGVIYLYKAEGAVISVVTTGGETPALSSSGHTLSITVSPASASKLVMEREPSNTATAGVAFSPQPQVRIEDAFGNLITTDNSTVITAARSTGNATLQGTLTATVSGGIATFSNLSYNKAETIDLGFTSSPSYTTTSSGNIDVSPNTATYLAITGTGTQTAGTSQLITVSAYDLYDNLATGYDGSKSLTFSGAAGSPNPSTLPIVAGTNFGTATSLTFASGIATGTMYLYKDETAQVSASDGTINSTLHKLSVVVSPATQSYFAITGYTPKVAGEAQTITVTAYDAFNNVATGYTGAQALNFTGANPSPAYLPNTAVNPTVAETVFGSSTSLSFSSGAATASMVLYKTETAAVTVSQGSVNADSHKLSVTVSAAPANYLAITGSSTQTAGIGQTITITAYDAFNNVATTYSGSKNLTFGGANASPVPVTFPTVGGVVFGTATSLSFSSGVATGGMTLYKTETASITVFDGTINQGNHPLSVLVSPTVLKDFVVSNVADPHDLGTHVSPTVEARDSYGNRKTNYVGTITFSNTDITATNPADYQFLVGDLGIHTFTNGVLFSQPGNWWLTALDLADPRKYGAQPDITVQRAVTITANNRTKTYGDVLAMGNSEFTVTGTSYTDVHGNTVSPVVAGEITGVTLTSAGSAATATVVAPGPDYAIVPSLATGPYTPAYYRIVYASTGQLTVNKRDLTLTNFLADAKTYDGTTTVTGPSGSRFSDNHVNSDVLTFDYAAAFASKNAALLQTVNYSDITISGAGAGNYTLVTTGGSTTANIAVRDINVTAQTDTKPYDGSTTSSVLPIVDAVQTGDAVTTVGIQTFDTETFGPSKVLTPSGTVINDGNSGANYAVHYVTNTTGTISTRPITITVTAGQTKVYGEANPTSYTYSVTAGSLADGDLFDGALSREAGENVNTYAIGQGSLTIIEGENNKLSNYAVIFEGANFTITQLPVTVTADASKGKTYGQLDPTLTYTSSPAVGTLLANGYHITFTGNVSRTTGETVASSPYAIGIGSLANSNYAITYNADNFTIAPLAVSVTANSGQHKTYGAVDATFAYTSSPAINSALPNGDHISFAGSLSRIAGEPVGNYAIGQGTLDNSNYTISYTGDNYAINQLAVTVTANASQGKTYGSLDPTLTYTSSPSVGTLLANGDLIAFTGNVTRATGESVGSAYAIGIGSLENSNYAIIYYTDNFAITPLAVTVTADAGQHKTYGDVDPAFTYASNPAVNSLLANGDAISFTGSLTRTAGEPVGNYTIGKGSLANSNYTITYNSAQFAIDQRLITLTATDRSKTYGTTLTLGTSAFTKTAGTYANSELATGVVFASAGAINTAPVTTYPITLGSATGNGGFLASNYNITYTPGTLTVDQKELTVISSVVITPKTYDGTIVANITGAVLSGVESWDAALVVLGNHTTGTYTQKNIGTGITVNTLPMTITGSAIGNYTLTQPTGLSGQIVVKPITGNFTANNKVYDGNDVAEILTRTPNGIETIDAGKVILTGGSAIFNNKNVADGKIVTPSGMSISGAEAGNYDLTAVNTTTANVTRRTLTLSNFLADTKTYDQNTSVIGQGFSNDKVTGDDLTFSWTPATFVDKNYGVAKVVNYTNIAISGGVDIGNYTLASTTGIAHATIDKKLLTLRNFAANDKEYDGGINVAFAPSFQDNRIEGDLLVFSGTAQFDNKEVGTTHIVTYSGITLTGGADKNNYYMTVTGGETTADVEITARALTITATAQPKTYGATLTSGTGFTGFTATGLQNGETIGTVTMTFGTGALATDPVNTYTNQALPSAATGGTFAVGNYTPTYLPGNIVVGNATPVITLTVGTNPTYDGLAHYVTSATVAGVAGNIGATTVVYKQGSTVIAAPTNSGVYDVTADFAATSNYNAAVQVTGTLTINKANLSVTAVASNITYGGSAPAVSVTYGSFQNGETSSVLDNVGFALGTDYTQWNNAGTYHTTISAGSATDNNYTLTPLNTSIFEVGKANAIIAVTPYNPTYDGNPHTATFTAVGIESPTPVNLASYMTVTGTTHTDAGTYTGDAWSFAENTNYNATSGTVDDAISKKALTISGAVAQNKEYDGTNVATITGATLVGKVESDDISLANYTAGTFVQTGIGTGIVVTPSMTISGGGIGNYTLTQPTGLSANITIKTITIIPTAGQSKLFGVTGDPTFTYTSSPDLLGTYHLYGTDNFTGALGRNGGTVPNVGNYSYTLGNLSAGPNYTLVMTGTPATFAILRNSQILSLQAGWNIISSAVIPANPNDAMSTVFNPLITATKLRKVMDEQGHSLEDWGGGTWVNNIGNLQGTEGYRVNVSSDCELTISGNSVPLPLSIPLTTGWNIISFPASANQNGKAAVQALIDAGKLVKVMDERGYAIEDWTSYGFGWQNNLGDFTPGKGYLVNVNAPCNLIINEVLNKAATITPEFIASTHFKAAFTGNGVDHMNINLMELNKSGIRQGDEIGIFDGSICVGAVTIGADQMFSGNVGIPVSANDGLSESINGYIQGNQVSLKLFSNGAESTMKTETLKNGVDVFRKGESLFMTVSDLGTTGLSDLSQQFDVKFYPNPFTDNLSIKINSSGSKPIDIMIYDVLGRKIRTLITGSVQGSQIVNWDGTTDAGSVVRPGVYYLRCNGLTFNGIIKR